MQNFLKGEKRRLIDGRTVTIVAKCGSAWKVINDEGRIELVYPGEFRSEENQ